MTTQKKSSFGPVSTFLGVVLVVTLAVPLISFQWQIIYWLEDVFPQIPRSLISQSFSVLIAVVATFVLWPIVGKKRFQNDDGE